MTLAYWCVLVTLVMPYLWAILSKTGGGYDNSQPRLDNRVGWRQRAVWAQANAWEAFSGFAIAIIIAQQVGAEQFRIDRLAIVFVVLRIAHGVAYVANRATLRTIAWLAGFACILGLFAVAGRLI